MTKRLPTEFAINMYLDKMIILQQNELSQVSSLNYFDSNSPCHIYFIGKRPRVIVDKDAFNVTKDYIEMNFKIQRGDTWKYLPLKFENTFQDDKLEFKTKYPYNTFEIYLNDELYHFAKVFPFLQEGLNFPSEYDFLDFEVLYIGQSYGVDGARTAPDRLVNHSTLQGIYAQAISNNPDSEIWLALASFSQQNLTLFDGKTKFTVEEQKEDKERYVTVFNKLNFEGLSEQQVVNFTEAALIKYFKPPYNKIYKDSFPNPAHSTYSECYDLDINSICIELNTSEIINCYFFSLAIERAPWHMKDFLLHSKEDRKSIFELP